ASGYGGVFKTEDGGLTWRRMKPRGGWYHVEMTGADEIWLLEGQHPGGLGKAWLWRSTDGGKTWNEELKGKLGHYWDLYCRGNERWALCGDSPCFRSDDGGATWRQERFGGLLQGAFKLAMPADVRTEKGLAVYVIGHHQRQPRLVKSLDSGKTWTTLPLPENLPERIFRYCLHFATSEMGWLGLTDGGVLFTADGGATWERRSLPTDQAVTALWLDQFGRGYAGASNSDHHRRRETLYETADGGKRWRAVLGGAKHVSALFGFGPGRLWAVGDVPGYVPNDLVAILDY
ncbi:MAG: hypothetical protein FJ279_23740, partial [Planctomycetes bacterium]|nr:hypothetical protein [Planctomycetota bacterium]